VAAVQARGVTVRAPQTLDVSPEVDPTRFEAGAVLHAGTRLSGARTMVRANAIIGGEGPAVLHNAIVGRNAQVRSGYVEGAVLFDGADVGAGAHIRSGTILEEGARTAHTVGLKQTILFPFVTLGSLINFCDCLMAGGSGPRDHSEVGSGFIHFNFTPRGPHGDKATPSLFGDVPRGVLLREPRIFLGGDGGVVGPITVGFGAVLAAGFTYRRDCPEGTLRVGETGVVGDFPFDPLTYGAITAKFRSNVRYIGQLVALHAWYLAARLTALAADDELGRDLVEHAPQILCGAVAERLKRLGDLTAHLAAHGAMADDRVAESHRAAVAAYPGVASAARAALKEGEVTRENTRDPDQAAFLAAWTALSGDYLARVRALPPAACRAATAWLQRRVAAVEKNA